MFYEYRSIMVQRLCTGSTRLLYGLYMTLVLSMIIIYLSGANIQYFMKWRNFYFIKWQQ